MIRPILLWWILASIAEAQIAYQTHYMPFTRSTGPVWMNMVDYSVSDSTGLVADPTSKIYVDARAWGLRLNAVRAESPVQLTPTAFPFASNKGFLARFVMTTVPAVSGSGPRSLFSLIAPGLYLNTPDLWVTLGHDNQAWSISRNANVSVNNGNILNQSRKFWQTPWDPLYDTIPTRQLLYWRLDPVGNAKIDRFVIYVDSEGTTRVQWDQGIQLAAIPLVSLTVGTPTSNPIKPDYYYWDDMYLAGQPNDAGGIKRQVGVKGDIDHFGAMSFLQGLLTVLRDSGHAGLYLVLDEVETIQRVRGDMRDKSLNALRQLIDDIDSGRFPGLYLMITGTGAFFDGPQGAQRLEPLAQRLHVDFQTDARFDNPRAVQIRLTAFDFERLCEVGRRIRDVYVMHALAPDRLAAKVSDTYINELARAVAGRLGGKVGVAPRIFLKKLVADILDRVDQFPEFDPHLHYKLTIQENELTSTERHAASASNVDEIELP
mgnify:CR=1 FL=1